MNFDHSRIGLHWQKITLSAIEFTRNVPVPVLLFHGDYLIIKFPDRNRSPYKTKDVDEFYVCYLQGEEFQIFVDNEFGKPLSVNSIKEVLCFIDERLLYEL